MINLHSAVEGALDKLSVCQVQNKEESCYCTTTTFEHPISIGKHVKVILDIVYLLILLKHLFPYFL